MLRPQHREWVRVESYGDHCQPLGVGHLAGAAYEVAVTEVDTVEVADDDDRATQTGRQVLEGTPDSHGVNTTWHCPTTGSALRYRNRRAGLSGILLAAPPLARQEVLRGRESGPRTRQRCRSRRDYGLGSPLMPAEQARE